MYHDSAYGSRAPLEGLYTLLGIVHSMAQNRLQQAAQGYP